MNKKDLMSKIENEEGKEIVFIAINELLKRYNEDYKEKDYEYFEVIDIDYIENDDISSKNLKIITKNKQEYELEKKIMKYKYNDQLTENNKVSNKEDKEFKIIVSKNFVKIIESVPNNYVGCYIQDLIAHDLLRKELIDNYELIITKCRKSIQSSVTFLGFLKQDDENIYDKIDTILEIMGEQELIEVTSVLSGINPEIDSKLNYYYENNKEKVGRQIIINYTEAYVDRFVEKAKVSTNYDEKYN